MPFNEYKSMDTTQFIIPRRLQSLVSGVYDIYIYIYIYNGIQPW